MQGAGGHQACAEPSPLDLISFEARLDRGADAPVALGFSGGGDSLALLCLTLDWARACGRRVLALTVDHGLQTQSASWTEQAGAQARRLGAEWRALTWAGPKPATGLPAAARQARHALLAEAARAAGAQVLLLGHTLDDVLEGERMRAAGSTLGRLQDWAPSPVWPQGRDVYLFRPLLDRRRADLRAVLIARGLDWLEDPANDDPRFLRARVRAELSQADAPARTPAPDFKRPACAPSRPLPGAFALARAGLSGADLAIAVTCASGRETPPRGPAVQRLLARIESGNAIRAVLSGARIEAGPTEVLVCREAGEAARGGLRSIRVEAGDDVVFDGRFEISACPSGEVRAVQGLASRLDQVDRGRLKTLPSAVRASLPVLIRDADARPILAERVATVRDLVHGRRLAACGHIAHEREITGLRVALVP